MLVISSLKIDNYDIDLDQAKLTDSDAHNFNELFEK